MLRDLPVANDRPRDQLRKHEQVERGFDRPLLRGGVLPVDVDDVRDRVKGEERDPDRKQNAGQRKRLNADERQRSVEIAHREIRVLEHCQHQQVDRYGAGQEPPAEHRGTVAVDETSGNVVEDDQREDEPGEVAGAARVENDARREQ